MSALLAEMGPEVHDRPVPTIRGSIVAAAAVLAVIGLGAIAIDSGDGGTNVVGIVLGLVIVGAGHAVLALLPGQVRAAGIALVALGTVMALGFIFDDVDSPAALLLLLAIAYAAQWYFGPARAAATLSTLALLSAWALLLDLVSNDGGAPRAAVGFDDLAVPDTTFTSGDDVVSYLSLAAGIALLLLTRALDNRGLHGIATSTLIVGDLAFVGGVFGIVATFEEDAAGAFIIIVAGAVLSFVGAGGERRLTTWLGGIGVLIGLLSLLATAVELDDVTQFGIVAAVTGAAIILAGAFLVPAGPTPAPDAADPVPVAASAPVATSPPVVESPPVAQTGWHADPTGRHQLRWHDGRSWTVNVADQGDVSTDEGV